MLACEADAFVVYRVFRRDAFRDHAERLGWNIFLPPNAFTTDNAAMVAMTGYFKYADGLFCAMDAAPYARVTSTIC